MKKKVVLTLSSVFPTTHPRKGERTFFKEQLNNAIYGYEGAVIEQPNAEPLFISGRKKHTIRENHERWQHNLDKIIDGRFTLSVREWSGKPYASPQVEIVSLHNVGYQRITMQYDSETDTLKASVDGKAISDVAQLAKNDGLTLDDFKHWFFGRKEMQGNRVNEFCGIIIHFTDFRY